MLPTRTRNIGGGLRDTSGGLRNNGGGVRDASGGLRNISGGLRDTSGGLRNIGGGLRRDVRGRKRRTPGRYFASEPSTRALYYVIPVLEPSTIFFYQSPLLRRCIRALYYPVLEPSTTCIRALYYLVLEPSTTLYQSPLLQSDWDAVSRNIGGGLRDTSGGLRDASGGLQDVTLHQSPLLPCIRAI